MSNRVRIFQSWLALFGLAALPWLVLTLALTSPLQWEKTSPFKAACWLAFATFVGLVLLLAYERLAMNVGRFCVGPAGPAMAFDAQAILAGQPTTAAAANPFEPIEKVRSQLQSAMDEEFRNIVQRVGWTFAGQAFLLSAFATLLTSQAVDRSLHGPTLLLVSVLGVLVSCSVLVGVCLGHGYVAQLRQARDAAEAHLQERHAMPCASIHAGSPLLALKHSTSRYLPAVTYVFWVALCIHVALPTLLGTPPPPTPAKPVATGRVWQPHFETSPSFEPSQYRWDVAGPAKPETCTGRGSEWAKGFVADWRRRPDPQATDVVMLSASADRRPLGTRLHAAMETSLSLARGRAQTAMAMLQACTRELPATDRLGPHRIMINTLAPSPGPAAQQALGRHACGNDCDEDRVVTLWYETGSR